MKATRIIAILAIGGLLVFVAVSVLGGSKDKAASPSTALRGVEGGVQPQVGDRYSVGSPLGTKSVPQQINYQGYLVNSSDTSAVTDTLEMTFRIYDEETGGSELWWETQSVSVENGLFNVLLGTPDSLFTGQALWLETTVEGETLSPRKKLVSVPYALKDPCWRDANVNDCVFDKSGSVGIGTTYLGDYKLRVSGRVMAREVAEGGMSWWDATLCDGSGVYGSYSTLWDKQELVGYLAGGPVSGPVAGVYGSSIGWAGYFNGKGYFSGNVGIGTTSPGAKLDVEVSSGGAATIGSNDNSATGDYAIAMGDNTIASGSRSIAMGHGTEASGFASTAMGLNTIASVHYATAMGWGSRASGQSSTAMGRITTASGYFSTAMGDNTTASGTYSTAMGVMTTASGFASTAMGDSTTASGHSSTAMGNRFENPNDYSLAIGYEDLDILFDANGNSYINSGNVGIGTTSPNYKLEVSGPIMMENTTAPTEATGHAGIYANLGELYAIDQNGNSTQLSPHDPETGEWVFYSKNLKTGRVVQINMEKLVKKVEELTGEKFMEEWMEQ